MTWVAVGVGGASVAGSIFSGVLGASGAKQSAEAQRYAAELARKTSLELNEKSRKDLAPFRDLGVQAGGTLSGILSGTQNISDVYKASSLYNFQSELGGRALDRQLSARGLSGSGAGLESLALFDKSLVAEEGDRYFNRLFETTKLGANAAAQQAQNNTSTGNTLAQVGTQAGIGIGQAYQNQYNALGQGVQGAFGAIRQGVGDYQTQQYLNQLFPSNGSGANSPGGYVPGSRAGDYSTFNPF
jgi:hypothetical protein